MPPLFRLTKGDKDDSYEWYRNHVEDRLEGTCQLFLNHKDFQRWLKQDSGLLLVSAGPGCGKSVLAKYLIDCRLPRSATICYFFLKDQDQNTIKQALCTLLHQLFSQQPFLMTCYAKIFREWTKFSKYYNDAMGILQKCRTRYRERTCDFCFARFRECTESDFRDLISMLKRQFQKHET